MLKQKKHHIVGAHSKRKTILLETACSLIVCDGAHVRMLTDYGIFHSCHDTFAEMGHRFQSETLCPLNLARQRLGIPLSDLSHQLRQGILNESTETEFTIHGRGNIVVINY